MPDFPCQDHKEKIAVLEVQVSHIQSEAADSRAWLQSIDGKVDAIKERLDKQNGAIPHMASDLTKLASSVSEFHDKLTTLQLSSTKVEVKTAVMWAVIVTVTTALLAGLIKYFAG